MFSKPKLKRQYITDCFADFETTSDTHNPEIAQWGLIIPKALSKTRKYPKPQHNKWARLERKEYYFYYGINGLDFIKLLQSINFKIEVWFVNGAKFDFHFILPILERNDYVFNPPQIPEINENFKSKKKLKDKDDQLNKILSIKYLEKIKAIQKLHKNASFKTIINQWEFLQENCYSYFTNRYGAFYHIKLASNYKKRNRKKGGFNNYRSIAISDILNIFPQLSVEKMGKILNETYQTTKYEKLDSHYDYKKLTKLDDLTNNKQDLTYLEQDLIIPYKFLNLMFNNLDLIRNDYKITVASIAKKQWEKSFGNFYAKLLKFDIYENRGYQQYRIGGKLYSHKKWRDFWKKEFFDVKWYEKPYDKETNYYKNLLPFYHGGISHVNEKYRGRLLKNIVGYDINSSYPSVMNSDLPYPYGKPSIGDDKNKPFKFYKITIKQDIKNKKGLPFLTLNDKEKDAKEYNKNLLIGEKYYFTSASYQQVKKYYKINSKNVKLEILFSFSQKKGKFFFGEFVNSFFNIKIKGKKNKNIAQELFAKYMLNSCYGGFATKQDRVGRVRIPEYEKKLWVELTDEIVLTTYFPIGLVITEYARMKLVNAVNDNYKNFMYCDTDSIYVNDKFNVSNITIDDKKLGDWKIEKKYGIALFRRPKQYIFYGFNEKQQKTKMHYVYASIHNFPDTINFRDFLVGTFITNQKRNQKTLSGCYIENYPKQIYPLICNNYKKLSEQPSHSQKWYMEKFNEDLIKIFNIRKKSERKFIEENYIFKIL